MNTKYSYFKSNHYHSYGIFDENTKSIICYCDTLLDALATIRILKKNDKMFESSYKEITEK